jgi:hypothetical protein
MPTVTAAVEAEARAQPARLTQREKLGTAAYPYGFGLTYC